jgi:hypothetical protein
VRNVIQNFSTNLDAGDYLEKAVIWGCTKMELNTANTLSFDSTMNITKRNSIYGSRSLWIIKIKPS